MKLRLAWLADAEDSESYSGRETRVLLKGLSRTETVLPLWFGVGSSQPPHFWHGIRVFPIPCDCLSNADFLRTLIDQQRPDILLSNLSRSSFPAAFDYLRTQNSVLWIDRINPADSDAEWESQDPQRHVLLINRPTLGKENRTGRVLPYMRGLQPKRGSEPSGILRELEKLFKEAAVQRCRQNETRNKGQGLREAFLPHLVMRQQLFCNASVAHVMFELSNALIEMGIPTVPQDEHAFLWKDYIRCEEELVCSGSTEKYNRIKRQLNQRYDPETAVTIHFSMLKHGGRFTRYGVFRALTPREVLYTTGNHTVSGADVRNICNSFERVFAPSWHVLRPYLEHGLSENRGAVIPHGIDPTVFLPESVAVKYKTDKQFKFLQTSFPWVYEKGFDLTVEAFCKAFSSRDDVALVLRTPRVVDLTQRANSFERLHALVREASGRPDAPEIVLLETDIPLGLRGGLYTGADCYVFPLRAEGFGMTILEAMACGLPVIATAWSGPADFLSPHHSYTLCHSAPIAERRKDGLILRYHVEPDLDHLVHLMREAYRNRDESKRLGRVATTVAHENWTWKHAALKLAACLSLWPEPVESIEECEIRQGQSPVPHSSNAAQNCTVVGSA